MKLRISRHSIEIIPENDQDEAYLEEVLGLSQNVRGQAPTCEAKRVNATGRRAWAYLQLKKRTKVGDRVRLVQDGDPGVILEERLTASGNLCRVRRDDGYEAWFPENALYYPNEDQQ